MKQHRLHIDIPLGHDEEKAVMNSEEIIYMIESQKDFLLESLGVEQLNYRLGHDEDRQKSNYLDKNENGHVSNKKMKIRLSDCSTSRRRMALAVSLITISSWVRVPPDLL